MSAPAPNIRVMVVDDNPVVRSGLVALLETGVGIEVVAEAVNGRDAVERAPHIKPDLVLLDVRMPLLDGVEAARLLSETTRVLMLTYTDDPDMIRSAVRNGAVGYLVHGEFTTEELLDAVSGAVRGGVNPLSPPAVTALMAAVKGGPEGGVSAASLDHSIFGLSARESDVMHRIAQGRTNTEIARDLFLTEKTVKNHVNRIYAKLGVENRAAAIARWLGTAEPSKEARP